MQRSFEPEILDAPDVPDELLTRAHAGLARIQRWLGNHRAIIAKLREQPVRRVLDVGCGQGALLREIERTLGVETVGVDLRIAQNAPPNLLVRDAIHDPLPQADAAVCTCVAHHLSPAELAALIRNVGRSCPRFLLLDLVRHPLPLKLFQTFVAPFVDPVNRHDGALSVRRAYTPEEFAAAIRAALPAGAAFEHTVAPLFIRQIADIRFMR